MTGEDDAGAVTEGAHDIAPTASVPDPTLWPLRRSTIAIWFSVIVA